MEENKQIKGSPNVIDSVSANYVKNLDNDKPKELTEEQKLEIERRGLGPSNFNRKMRRDHLKGAGILKMKNKLHFGSPEWIEWYDKTRTEGKRIHAENTDAVTKQKEWYIEQADLKKREHLTNFYTNAGWSEAEVKAEVEKQMDSWYDVVIDRKDNIRHKDHLRKQKKQLNK